MRHAAGLVFDEVIETNKLVYTSSGLNELLAAADQVAIQLIVDDCVIPGGVTLSASAAFETSADGINWLTKQTSPEVAPFTVSATDTTVSPFSYDSGVLPTLRFARLRLMLSASPPAACTAHVRAYVTLRDSGGGVTHAPLIHVRSQAPGAKPHDPEFEPENTHVTRGHEGHGHHLPE